MSTASALANLALQIKTCQRCPLSQTATQAVPGAGNPQSKLVFIGEAPGFFEDKSGQPFVGRAGQLLNQALAKINLARTDIYITNIVKHRPPNNRDPLPLELTACQVWLATQLQLLQPKVIVTLGRFALNYFLPEVLISQVHGKFQTLSLFAMTFKLLPLYHPAAALRNSQLMVQFNQDFTNLQDLTYDQ